MRELFLLEDEELQRIHHTSLRILGETGIAICHPQAVRIMQQHGARVDSEQQRVWLSEELIGRALPTVAREFTLTGSEPVHDVPLGAGHPLRGRPVVGADFFLEPGATSHRPTTLRNAEDWIRLVEQLPNIHLNGSPYPSDVPAAIRDLLVVERVFELSHKPMLLSHYSADALRWSLELVSALPRRADGQAQSRLLLFVSCNSPLTYTRSQVDILIMAGQQGVPVAINTAPLAGATAPYTVAGMAAQMNAELLAGVVVSQLSTPGAPVIWSPLPLVFDMRAGVAASGYAEIGLLLAILMQLGKLHGLPVHCLGLLTDAVIPDAQAGCEKLQAAYPALLARPHLMGGAGGLASYNVGSLEQLILDDEILGSLFHILEGMELDDDALGWDVINRVGPGGHFLEDVHTLRYLRRQYYSRQTANRLAPETWASAGALDTRSRATEQVQMLLAKPENPVVSGSVLRHMRGLVQRAQKDLASSE